MGKVIDLTGQKFGRLTVLSLKTKCSSKGNRSSRWNCICECGVKKDILSGGLRSGKTLSCGCLKIEKTKEYNATKFNDLTNKRIGRLTVLSRAENLVKGKRVRSRWNVKCDCGVEKIIISDSLVDESIKSCGCLKVDLLTTHGMVGTKTYACWTGMIQRCTNSKSTVYKDYGGRGITVCERWLKFENFYADMGDCPDNKSIDRINNNKGYSPDNCRWATRSQQVINTRPQKNTITGVRGVRARGDRFGAHIKVNGKQINLGGYAKIEDATAARRKAELKYFGQYFPTE